MLYNMLGVFPKARNKNPRTNWMIPKLMRKELSAHTVLGRFASIPLTESQIGVFRQQVHSFCTHFR